MKKIILSFFLILNSWSYAITLNVVASDINWTASGPLGYNPFDRSEYVQQIFFDINFSTNQNTSLAIGFAQGSYPSYTRRAYDGSNYITYTLHKTDSASKLLEDYPDFTHKDKYIGLSIAKNDTSPVQVSYYMRVDKEQDIDAGTYTDVFNINVYEGTNKNIQSLLYTEEINVTIIAASSMQIAINEQDFGDTDQYLMDIGDTISGQSTAFTIKVRSTSKFKLSALSENQGSLHHSDAAINSTIPYTYNFDGTDINLSGSTPIQMLVKNSGTKAIGLSYDANITILDTSQAPAGDYSDIITYTMSEL